MNQLIQVCYGIDDYKTKKREINAIVKAAHETGCDNLTVITWDYEAKETAGGRDIYYLPLWKWLLEGRA